LVKIVTIILFKFKNVCFEQLFKTYHNMFSAVLRHSLVTSKDRDCISVSRSFVACCLSNVGHWYRDNISRSLPKVRRKWEIKWAVLLGNRFSVSATCHLPKVVRRLDIKWAVLHGNRFSVSPTCHRAGRAETDEQQDQQLKKKINTTNGYFLRFSFGS